jgi:hypothetical protein
MKLVNSRFEIGGQINQTYDIHGKKIAYSVGLRKNRKPTIVKISSDL